MKNDNVESYQEMEKRLRRKSIIGVSIAFILPISVIIGLPYLHLLVG